MLCARCARVSKFRDRGFETQAIIYMLCYAISVYWLYVRVYRGIMKRSASWTGYDVLNSIFVFHLSLKAFPVLITYTKLPYSYTEDRGQNTREDHSKRIFVFVL